MRLCGPRRPLNAFGFLQPEKEEEEIRITEQSSGIIIMRAVLGLVLGVFFPYKKKKKRLHNLGACIHTYIHKRSTRNLYYSS